MLAPPRARHRSAGKRATCTVLTGLAVLWAGCATPPVAEPSLQGPQLQGRLALSVASTDATPARSASLLFEWSGGADAGVLQLSSPLGTQLAELRWQPGRADLRTADGLQSFPDLDALTGSLLGERLPIAAMSDWLRGRPWSGAPAEPADPAGPANPASASAPTGLRFRQAGWSVDLSGRAEGRIDALRASPPPAVRLRIRLDPPSP